MAQAGPMVLPKEPSTWQSEQLPKTLNSSARRMATTRATSVATPYRLEEPLPCILPGSASRRARYRAGGSPIPLKTTYMSRSVLSLPVSPPKCHDTTNSNKLLDRPYKHRPRRPHKNCPSVAIAAGNHITNTPTHKHHHHRQSCLCCPPATGAVHVHPSMARTGAICHTSMGHTGGSLQHCLPPSTIGS